MRNGLRIPGSSFHCENCDGPVGVAGEFMCHRCGCAHCPYCGAEIYGDTGAHCIWRLSTNGVPLARWGAAGRGLGQFRSPSGIAVDADGCVCVADAGTNRVQKLSGRGEFISSWGWDGTEPGCFLLPVGIAIDAVGAVYVSDSDNCRVQRFTAAGDLIYTLGAKGLRSANSRTRKVLRPMRRGLCTLPTRTTAVSRSSSLMAPLRRGETTDGSG
jgi:hypothetical protein